MPSRYSVWTWEAAADPLTLGDPWQADADGQDDTEATLSVPDAVRLVLSAARATDAAPAAPSGPARSASALEAAALPPAAVVAAELPEIGGVGLRLYAWMALDAYDHRIDPLDSAGAQIVDPDIATYFGDDGWSQVSGGRIGTLRASTISGTDGFDANFYINRSTDESVLAFRGTELSAGLAVLPLPIPLRETAAQFEAAVAAAGLERTLAADVLTLFGYYQDGGDTVFASISDEGALTDFLTENLGYGFFEAITLAGIIGLLAEGFESSIRSLASLGEALLASQARSAIDATLTAADAFDGDTLTVTGHSLGGALSAYVVAALGLDGVALDPAPYADTGFLAQLRGYAETALSVRYPGLDPAALGFDLSEDAVDTVIDRLDTVRIGGSFVPDLYLTSDPGALPEGEGTDTVIDLSARDALGLDLHSADLHALLIDSDLRADRRDLEELAEDLPSLIAQLLDPGLTARPELAPGTFTPVLRALLIDDALYQAFEDGLEDVVAQGLPGPAEEAAIADVLTQIADAAAASFGSGDAFDFA